MYNPGFWHPTGPQHSDNSQFTEGEGRTLIGGSWPAGEWVHLGVRHSHLADLAGGAGVVRDLHGGVRQRQCQVARVPGTASQRCQQLAVHC